MNRHAVAGNDDNSQSHHESLEEIAQLRNHERMLIGENDDLRRQLVEMKKEEKKKFDALLVEHQQLQSSNADRLQRTENDASLVLTAPNDIHIKQEYLDDQSDNGQAQQMDNEDADTNAHNVNVNIKTEPMDCDFVVVKEEIKEEDDEDTPTNTNQVTVKTESNDEDVKVEIKEEDDHDDDCDGRVLCLVKKEELSDDDEQVNDHGSVNSTNQVKKEFKEEGKEDHEDDCGCDRFLVKKDEHEDNEGGGRGQGFEEMDDEGGDHKEVIGANGDQLAQSSHVLQSSDEQANNDEVMNQENGLGDDDDEMCNGAKDNHDCPMVVSNEASTSSRARSNRVTSKQSTGSTVHNVNKRKQTRTNRTVKRSKKTVEVGDDENGDDGDIATDDQVVDKLKILYFDCTESNCEVKLNSLDQLYGHLNTIHGLVPHRCFAQNCNARCGNRQNMAVHIKEHHSTRTQFVCHSCGKQFFSQKKTCNHWIKYHLTGQFQCNLNECTKEFDTRQKVHCHQQYKHCPESKRFKCHRTGCSSTFATSYDLKRHESTHLNTRPFHCTWPQCSHSTNRRSNLLTHIRTQHF